MMLSIVCSPKSTPGVMAHRHDLIKERIPNGLEVSKFIRSCIFNSFAMLLIIFGAPLPSEIVCILIIKRAIKRSLDSTDGCNTLNTIEFNSEF